MPFNNKEYKYKYISAATTTVVGVGRGTLHNITVNATAAGVVRICDAITGTTANIGMMKASIVEGTYGYDVVFSKGLIIDTAGASDLTISYTQG